MRRGRIFGRTLAAGIPAALAMILASAAPALGAPTITIDSPTGGSVTNDRTPIVAGQSSDPLDAVTVTVFSEGSPIQALEAQPEALSGEWSAEVSEPLKDGPYVLVAEQTEGLTGESGQSSPVEFAVHASKPAVTLNAVSSPTKDSTPSFSGTASETTGVTVSIYEGSSVSGSPVAEAHASGTGGSWSSGGASSALADGTYTAVAEQESSFENGPGFSQERTFTVHTAKPVVTLNEVSSPTKDSTPSFSGTASETTDVTVSIYEGSSVSGSPVAEAHASGTGGSWSSGGAGPALADGTYTAVAEQESAFGDGPGSSEERTFTVDTKPPSVTLNEIASPSGDISPSFTGTASDTTAVTVHVFKGTNEVTTATAPGTGGAWSSGATESTLGEGSYTAVATQESSHSTGTGTSAEIAFTVIASPPKVKLSPVAALSNDATPTFSGTASDTNPVTIRIFSGETEVAAAAATGTGGAWTSGQASPPLSEGRHEYRAVAEQESSFGKGPGFSEERTFIVDTRSPTVTLDAIATPSNDPTPTFSGEATDSTTVVVHVFDAGNKEVASASGNPSGGKWVSGSLSKALSSGSYQAVAVQTSSLGNPPGQSANVNFTVNTEAPHVTLDAPAARSSNTSPSFSGTAADTMTVTVSVFKGTTATGTAVATATASGTGGAWASGPVSKALSSGTYTARAVQKSSLANPDGVSEARTFEVDTQAPAVTLNQPPVRSNDTTPSFSGTASESEPITISVFKGSSPSGSPVATATAPGTGGAWNSGAVSKALEPGTYTARAAQKSSIGNPEGLSEARTFVIDTSAPTVKLEPVAALSNDTTPTFKGTATDSTGVTVSVYAGSLTSGTPVATATGGVSGGSFSTSGAAPALPNGKYTALAREPSSIGNPEGESNKVAFAVNTSPPTVTLEALPAARTNSVTPAFHGTVVDNEKEIKDVTVHVREAGKAVDVATATTHVTGKEWTASGLAPALAKGRTSYEAFATQPSSLGNEEGKSNAISFVVDTEPPTVTLEQIATPSNDNTPTFNGTASDVGEVTVEIVGGKSPIKAKAHVVEGKWSTGAVPLPAAKAEYLATASQPSSIGNATGKSKSIEFVVDPSAPTVVMSPVKAQIDTPTPTFTGTAGSKPVTVAICKITTVPCPAEQGEWTAKSLAGGAWSATLTTPLEDGQYQAIASERSATGALGASERQLFTIDTVAPVVTVSVPAQGATVIGGSVTAKGAAGTAGHDSREVSLELFGGSSIAPGQTPAQAVKVATVGGVWSAAFGGLTPGRYTLRASQLDEAGNVGAASHSFIDAAPGKPSSGPSASFAWYPSHPHVGETVMLVSTSTDSASPITGFAWNLLGSAFASGAQKQPTSFSTPGNHPIGLRVTDAAGLAAATSQQIPVSLPQMRPFPAVRIVTTGAARGVRLKLLSVEAPAGVTVKVNCTGRGCPLRSLSRVVPRPKAKSAGTPSLSFTRFRGVLRPGVALEVRVEASGQIGKFTRFAIRRRKLPLRSDACLNAREPRPVSCSS